MQKFEALVVVMLDISFKPKFNVITILKIKENFCKNLTAIYPYYTYQCTVSLNVYF